MLIEVSEEYLQRGSEQLVVWLVSQVYQHPHQSLSLGAIQTQISTITKWREITYKYIFVQTIKVQLRQLKGL